jgi:hypothetical protein
LLGIDIDSGRRRVVERPWVDDRCFISLSLEVYVEYG